MPLSPSRGIAMTVAEAEWTAVSFWKTPLLLDPCRIYQVPSAVAHQRLRSDGQGEI